MHMIYVDTRGESIYYNFGAELYFADKKDLGEEVFMLWTTEPTIVIGKYQNPFEEVDMNYARNNGINVVRRNSGGGTVYMDRGGWQFSFVARGAEGDISFAEYMKPVVDALIRLGVPAVMSGRNDILADGRKISGNSQYKTDLATVHHGTLLYSANIESMVRATTVDEYKFTSKSIKSVKERVVNICEYAPEGMTSEQFGNYMVEEILKTGKRYVITPEDDKIIREIAARFEDPERLRVLSPRFSVKKVGRFKGGSMYAEFEVKKGAITFLNLSGDFFASKEVADITQKMVGCPYDKDEVLKNFKQASCGAFYNITDEEIAALIYE